MKELLEMEFAFKLTMKYEGPEYSSPQKLKDMFTAVTKGWLEHLVPAE
jgi:hypothetical protein